MLDRLLDNVPAIIIDRLLLLMVPIKRKCILNIVVVSPVELKVRVSVCASTPDSRHSRCQDETTSWRLLSSHYREGHDVDRLKSDLGFLYTSRRY